MISSTKVTMNGWQRAASPSRPWGYGPGVFHPRFIPAAEVEERRRTGSALRPLSQSQAARIAGDMFEAYREADDPMKARPSLGSSQTYVDAVNAASTPSAKQRVKEAAQMVQMAVKERVAERLESGGGMASGWYSNILQDTAAEARQAYYNWSSDNAVIQARSLQQAGQKYVNSWPSRLPNTQATQATVDKLIAEGQTTFIDETLARQVNAYRDAYNSFDAGITAEGIANAYNVDVDDDSRLSPEAVNAIVGDLIGGDQQLTPDMLPLGFDFKDGVLVDMFGQPVGENRLMALWAQDIQENRVMKTGMTVGKTDVDPGQWWSGPPTFVSEWSLPSDDSFFSAWSRGDAKRIPLEGTYKGQAEGEGRYQGWASNPAAVGEWQNFFQVSGLYAKLNADEARYASAPGVWGPIEQEAFTTMLAWANNSGLHNANIDTIKRAYLEKQTAWDATFGGPGGGGSPRSYPYTQTNTTVSLSNLQTARAVLTSVLSNMIGRRATDAEEKAFLRELNNAERANPTTTTTTYTSPDVSESYTTSGGVDGGEVVEDWVTGDEVLSQKYDNYQRLRFFLSMQDMIFGSGRPTSAGMRSPWNG